MRDQLLDQVRQLGREFVRRGMRREAEGLRLYYVAIRSGLVRGPDGELEAASWSRSSTEEWLKLLRVPPWDRAYPLGTRGHCHRCKAAKGGPARALEERRWPGGALIRCTGCGSRWVVDDAEAQPGSMLIHAPRWTGGGT